MAKSKQPTTLTWLDTTREDCFQISSWSDKNLLTVKTEATSEAVDKLNRFLNSSPNNGVGSFLLGYIKKQPGDFYYYEDPSWYNDSWVKYGVKSAYDHGKLVGFVAFDSKFIATTGETEYHILMYAVNPELQGLGYATAMFFDMKQHPQYIFGTDYCKVSMMVDVENVGCRRVISKVGATIDTEKMAKMTDILDGFGLVPKMEEFVLYADGRNHEQITEVIDKVVAESKQETTTKVTKVTPGAAQGKGKK